MVRAVALDNACEKSIELGVDGGAICFLEPAHDVQNLLGGLAVDHRVADLGENTRIADAPVPRAVNTGPAIEPGDLPERLQEAEERRRAARGRGCACLPWAL
jgi:hypothetical protein